MNRSIWPGGNLKLSCPSPSNLAETSWERDGKALTASTPRFQLLRDQLLIFNATGSDTGRYRCLSVEPSKADKYTTTVAEYLVSMGSPGSGDGRLIFPEAQTNCPSVAGLHAVIGLLVVALLGLLAWNFYKGHLPLPWNCGKKNSEPSQETNTRRTAPAEDKPLVLGTNNGSNNNHTGGEAAFNAADEEEDGPKVSLPSLQYIDDESEI